MCECCVCVYMLGNNINSCHPRFVCSLCKFQLFSLIVSNFSCNLTSLSFGLTTATATTTTIKSNNFVSYRLLSGFEFARVIAKSLV